MECVWDHFYSITDTEIIKIFICVTSETIKVAVNKCGKNILSMSQKGGGKELHWNILKNRIMERPNKQRRKYIRDS